jgi:outer membrane protein assembly factor BamB
MLSTRRNNKSSECTAASPWLGPPLLGVALRAQLFVPLLALPVTIGLAPPAHAQERERFDQVEVKSFALPETRAARALFERAEQHAGAGRFAEAMAHYQALIEEHAGDVLAAERPAGANGRTSQQPVHPGAAQRARERLFALPPAARALYRDRYEAEARSALERARKVGERAGLAAVARRWPLCPASREAWWALGDLELERGDPDAAREAWRRAEELAAGSGDELSAGASARLALFDAGGPVAPPARTPAAANLALPGPGEAPGTPPGPACEGWQVRIDGLGLGERGMPPFNAAEGEFYDLFPVKIGDVLLVSTSMRLWAIDAWSGEKRWRSSEAPGWDQVDARRLRKPKSMEPFQRKDFYGAIDREALIVAPAAGSGVAVAALQIPVTQLSNERFQQIEIYRVIPDRRLFAFDLASGEELWNHLPPPLWDGESGSFAERMRVAAPPVIAGSRVLVPTYRMQGRVDYHLACYDLFTGRLLWSASLISGQTELNMFGRHLHEYAAAPVVVAGGRVLALTHLGTLAAVDLYTGDILWESLYDRVPLPATEHYYQAPRRDLVWKNAPPVVVGRTVIAAPLDSTDLIGVDLENGSLAWSLPSRDLWKPELGSRALALLGADERSLYLAGRTAILALDAPQGLAQGAPPAPRRPPLSKTYISSQMQEFFPRPALGERTIVVPTLRERLALDRANLGYQEPGLSAEWEREMAAGNVLLGEGALFTLSSKYLSACFDWKTLEQRYSRLLAEAPGDPDLALDYTAFLARQAHAQTERAKPYEALRLLARAREVLEPLLAEGGAVVPRSRLERQLHEVLRLEADALIWQADTASALERLERARALARDEDLRDTLLWIAHVATTRGDRARWEAALAELEARCAGMSMPEEGEALASETPRYGGLPSALGRADEPAGRPMANVGLWVLAERARAAAADGNARAELEALHAVLERYGNVPLPSEDGAAPSERIKRVLALAGSEVYAPFEERARALYVAALASGEPEALARVAELYPDSAAAREAGAARLAAALEDGDAATIAQLVQGQIPDPWSPARATPREVQLALALAAAAEGLENRPLARAILGSLARRHADVVSERPADRGRSVGELAAELAREPKGPREPATFDASAPVTRVLDGQLRFFATLEPSSADAPRALLCWLAEAEGDRLVAFSADEPGRRLWSFRPEFEPNRSVPPALVDGARVVVVGAGALAAVDAVDGSLRWTWRQPSRFITAASASGVVVALVDPPSLEGTKRLFGIDAVSGLELWSRDLEPGPAAPPLCGPEHVVILPAAATRAPAQVLDLFTGSLSLELDLRQAKETDRRAAWIDDTLLILPCFDRASAPPGDPRDCVSAWSLEDGRKAWRVAAEDGRDLSRIARWGRETYLVFLAGAGSGWRAAGMIQELDTRLGLVRTVQNVGLAPGDEPVGLLRHSVTAIDGPYLFLLASASGGSETLVRAIHLPFGERWVHRLPVPREELYNAAMPLPALSQSTVALCYGEPAEGRGAARRTALLFLDKSDGALREGRILPEELGRAEALELRGAGSSLWIQGAGAMLAISRR